MPDQGLSSADFRKRAGMGTLTKNGVTHSPSDDMDRVLADSRKLAAVKASGAMVTNLEVEAIDAENKRLESQMKNQQLKEMLRPAKAQPEQDQWIQYILGKVDQNEQQLSEARSEARHAEQAMLHQQLEMLSGELVRLRDQAKANPDSGDEFDILTRKLDQAKAFIERFNPPPQIVEPQFPSYDPSLEKWKMTLDNEREQRRIEADERRADREFERLKWQQLQEREERRLDRESEQHNRFIGETVPKLANDIMPLFRTFLEKQTAAPAVAQAAPQVAADIQQADNSIPEGFKIEACETCGFNILYRDGLKTIVCGGCGAVYGDPSIVAAPTAAAATQPRQEIVTNASIDPSGSIYGEDE